MTVDVTPSGGLFGVLDIEQPTPLLTLVWDPHGEPRRIDPGELDTIKTGLARIYFQWADKPNVRALFEIIGTGFASAVSEQYEISQFRYLSNAYGETLDELGALVGLERLGLDDPLYTPAIRARGASLIGDAGIDAVMAPAKAILGEGNVSYLPAYPRAYCYLVTIAVSIEILELLVRLLTPVPGAGIGAKILLAPPESPGWDHTTAQTWAGSWTSVHGATDASVVASWSFSVSLV